MYPVIEIGTFTIPTYVLIISLIFSGGIFWLLGRAQIYQLDRTIALDLALVVMISGFLGSRLLHIVFEEPQYYWENPLEVFKVWQGGFVFYGGLVSAWFSGVYFVKRKKQNIWIWHDVFAPIVSLGYSLGRVACFLAGCCYGRATEAFWGVRFPPGVSAPTGIKLHPTQLYASFWELGVFLILIALERRQKNRLPMGMLFSIWLVLHACGRLLMEYFRIDHRGPLFLGISISSALSIALIIFGLTLNRRLIKIAKL